MPFIDLHCHLLPGIDDGADGADEAVAMLRIAHASGTRTLVATPHFFLPPWDNSDPLLITAIFERLTEHLAELVRRAPGEELAWLNDLTLYLGAENSVSPEFFEAMERGDLVTLNSSRYVLIEFPPFLPFEVALSAVERVLQAGFFPVLAHVERYPFFQKGLKRLAGFLEMGCVAQLNAATVLGAAGRGGAKLAGRLLDAGLIQIIASDGHGAEARLPDLGRAAAGLAGRYPPDRIALWMWENPARILANKAPVR